MLQIQNWSSRSMDKPNSLSDLKQKIELVKCILLRCQAQEQGNMTFNSLYSTVIYYTVESTHSIKTALNSNKRIDFKRWWTMNDTRKAAEVSVYDIHAILYTHYVKNRNLLFKSDIIKHLVTKYTIPFDDLEPIFKKQGFVWRNVPNTNKCLLIEDPEQQARRIEYLLKMAQYREEMRPFVYVEAKKIHTIPSKFSKDEKFEHLVLAASPQMGIIDISFLSSDTSIDKWLESEVYPHLNKPTVLVYDHNRDDFTMEPPKPESTKKEMIEWLEQNRVAHHSAMRRPELYKLIEIYAMNEKKCPRDEILKTKGIAVLRCPTDWTMLNYFNIVWRRVELLSLWKCEPSTSAKPNGKKFLIKDQFLSTISMFTVGDDWQQFHGNLAIEENTIFEKDMELEEVIDKLLTMAKHEDLSKIPLSECHHVGDVFDKYNCVIMDRWKGDNEDDDVLEVFLDD